MTVLLALAPLLLFLATLLSGRARLARLGCGQRAPVALPRGGRLIAGSLAQRGPPGVLVVP